ncbi:phage baseplate assembly protein V [Brevundimonas intermedia]|nr:phage baseplate assembly protein V [Brevundimonas intermedia]
MNRRAPTSNAETDLTIGNLVRVGVVHSVDFEAGTAIVRFGEELSPPIDWDMPSGRIKIWAPPTVGEQVEVSSPEGDIEQGTISSRLKSSQFAPLFLGAKFGIGFEDGALIVYDPETHLLSFDLPGSATIRAPDGVRLIADLDIEGNLKVSGAVTADVDVVGGGKSLKGHKHTGVQTGSGVSGAPQ